MKRQILLRLIIKNVVLQLTIALLLFLTAFTGIKVAEKLGWTQSFYLLNKSGQAVISNGITKWLTDHGTSVNYRSAIVEFPESSSLVKKKTEFNIRLEDKASINQRINPDYPLFIENGAYLYLYYSNFLMIMDDFSREPSCPDTYLSGGVLFNRNQQNEGNKKVLMLQLPNGLYINSQKLQLQNGSKKITIGANSIIQLKKSGLSLCILKDKDIAFEDISITQPEAVLSFGKKSLSYDAFYEKLKASPQDKKEKTLDVTTSKSDLYQYFLGNRYEYVGLKTFYRTDSGCVMQSQDNLTLLTSAPLYYQGEKKILMPCDYVIIQPKLYRMNKMPAMTELTYDKGVVYTSYGKALNALTDFVLYDGEDTYLFFDKTEISWGGEKVTLPPCSSITVDQDGSIGIYNDKKDEYLTYQVDGYQDINATIGKDITLNLGQDILYRPDGKEQLLFSEPALLNSVE